MHSIQLNVNSAMVINFIEIFVEIGSQTVFISSFNLYLFTQIDDAKEEEE